MYKDIKTGEILKKVSEWEIYNGEKIAYFKAKSGATFSMEGKDVQLIR